MKLIEREQYLNRIKALKDTPDIKIIFVDFMDLEYEEIKEYHALHKYIEDRYENQKRNYVFVDEVQLCPQFELAVNSLHVKGKYDIYI